MTEEEKKVQMMKEKMAQTLIREFLEGMKQLGFTQNEAIQALEKENQQK